MTKQDKIREVLAEFCRVMRVEGRLRHYTPQSDADDILEFLHSQGVVIKVARDLPLAKWEEVKGTAVEVDTDTWGKMLAMVAVIYDRAFKAGYVAVEPLIKEA